jgi:hypothetical protein
MSGWTVDSSEKKHLVPLFSGQSHVSYWERPGVWSSYPVWAMFYIASLHDSKPNCFIKCRLTVLRLTFVPFASNADSILLEELIKTSQLSFSWRGRPSAVFFVDAQTAICRNKSLNSQMSWLHCERQFYYTLARTSSSFRSSFFCEEPRFEPSGLRFVTIFYRFLWV